MFKIFVLFNIILGFFIVSASEASHSNHSNHSEMYSDELNLQLKEVFLVNEKLHQAFYKYNPNQVKFDMQRTHVL